MGGRYSSLWPRQAARGTASQALLAANVSFIGLFNNSTADKLLIVRDFNIVVDSGVCMHVPTRGSAGVTPNIPGFSMVNGDPTPFGLLFKGNQGAAPGGDYQSFSNWPHDVPFEVIQPGWSSIWYSVAVNVNLEVSFVWEFIDAADLSTWTEKLEDQA